ncbi:hypothetical protein [Endozoicomonas sp. 8E]|uniref:hypothetical protein n=1 Tax=Endozoicomonas sp. 8E TaxID=3035692 RepID=UPI0029394C02|nr:hypothetical protein [Endozoicomonas sp. 8E]WOG27089.1 hypothetical protein P6910_21440 [Endozoicomonas sp. 8E]
MRVLQNRAFFIERSRHTLPPHSNIADTNSYTGSDSPSDRKRHRHGCSSIIESISWQWLYATNLLVAFELILTNQDASYGSNPYSWLPLETVVAVSCLLKSFWNLYSPLFNPIEQRTLLMLTQDHRFATVTTMFGSGHNPRQCQPLESSGQPPLKPAPALQIFHQPRLFWLWGR